MTNKEAIQYLIPPTTISNGGGDCPVNKHWIAYKMAIKALEQEPTWIPVSERLPEPQKHGVKDFSDWVEVTIIIGKDKDAYVVEAYYCFSEHKWYTERFVIGKVVA